MGQIDLEEWLDRQAEESTRRVRELIYEAGRPDLVEELDRKLKDIRLGIDSARGCWHALSYPQKEILRGMVTRGWYLRRKEGTEHRWLAHGDPNGCIIGGFYSGTVRNLMARELVTWATGDRKVIITERGCFVFVHGPKPC